VSLDAAIFFPQLPFPFKLGRSVLDVCVSQLYLVDYIEPVFYQRSLFPGRRVFRIAVLPFLPRFRGATSPFFKRCSLE